MPDLKEYTVLAFPPEQREVEIFRLDIRGKLTDGETVIGDFTENNAVRCYVLVEGLTASQHQSLVDAFAGMILRLRSGLE